jgi:phosphoribosylanthranilate isomerase
MTKVKICGITNLEDALLSAKFGADALGFNFYKKSPRYILPEKAREIIENLHEEILKVGVFVNETLENVAEIAKTANLNAIQLHGEETPEFCRELKLKTSLEIIKAFRVSPDFSPEDVLKYEVDAILLDAYNPKEHGGTGETFDWEIAKKVRAIFPKMYLAGGLNHENILRAIQETKPFAVDVCSGIESEKGKKDRVNLINLSSKISYLNSMESDKEDLFHFLRQIQIYQGMNLPKKSITQLVVFLFGFLCAMDLTKIDSEKTFDSLGRFEKFIGIKERGIHLNGIYSYIKHFLEISNGDEERAFDLFFALLEDFKLEQEDLSENLNMVK